MSSEVEVKTIETSASKNEKDAAIETPPSSVLPAPSSAASIETAVSKHEKDALTETPSLSKLPASSSAERRMSLQVADHYNSVPEKGITARLESRILYLRNFNNWIKSMLINDFLERLKQSGCERPIVLDLCCGKGGDLLKWRNGNILHLVATDIAEVSLRQCEKRYNEMKGKSGRRPLFSAEFVLADSSKDRLIEQLGDKNIQFDMTSCQFSFHYSFESERQARQMIRNAVERLRSGGFFIGTLPDANRIMYCLRKDGSGTYKNEVLRLEYGDKEGLKDKKHVPPVFGASFHFSLDTQVNCPEYLVHFPVLEKLLNECGMDLVYAKSFPEAFDYFMKNSGGRGLLERMKALETFPPSEGISTVGGPDEYLTAKARLEELSNEGSDVQGHVFGTLSKSEWEAAAMYLVFAFQKR